MSEFCRLVLTCHEPKDTLLVKLIETLYTTSSTSRCNHTNLCKEYRTAVVLCIVEAQQILCRDIVRCRANLLREINTTRSVRQVGCWRWNKGKERLRSTIILLVILELHTIIVPLVDKLRCRRTQCILCSSVLDNKFCLLICRHVILLIQSYTCTKSVDTVESYILRAVYTSCCNILHSLVEVIVNLLVRLFKCVTSWLCCICFAICGTIVLQKTEDSISTHEVSIA